MKYLLDTDHISILQRRSGPEFAVLSGSDQPRVSGRPGLLHQSASMSRFWAVMPISTGHGTAETRRGETLVATFRNSDRRPEQRSQLSRRPELFTALGDP